MNGYYGTHKYMHASVSGTDSIAALKEKVTAVMKKIEG